MKRSLTLVMAVAATFAAGAAQADTIRLMTGPQGGVWVPLGGALKNMWEKAIPGLQVQTAPGAGIANVRGVDEGKADVGFGNSITSVDGVHGRPPYPQKVTKACQLANLYPQYFQVVALATSGINSIADLKGKSIAVQPKGNTAELDLAADPAVRRALLPERQGELREQLHRCRRAPQGRPRAGVHPGDDDPRLLDHGRGRGRDIKMVPVTDEIVAAMRKMNPGYVKGSIKARHLPEAGQGRARDRLLGAPGRRLQPAGADGVPDGEGDGGERAPTWPRSTRPWRASRRR